MASIDVGGFAAAMAAKRGYYEAGLSAGAAIAAHLADTAFVLDTLRDIDLLPECPEREET